MIQITKSQHAVDTYNDTHLSHDAGKTFKLPPSINNELCASEVWVRVRSITSCSGMNEGNHNIIVIEIRTMLLLRSQTTWVGFSIIPSSKPRC
jgi:hypothetical protein